jgi:large subunit ribosomal protein L29
MKSTELVKELRSLSIEELSTKLKDTNEEVSNLTFQAATSALTNPIKLRTLRRTIARIKTILNEK